MFPRYVPILANYNNQKANSIYIYIYVCVISGFRNISCDGILRNLSSVAGTPLRGTVTWPNAYRGSLPRLPSRAPGRPTKRASISSPRWPDRKLIMKLPCTQEPTSTNGPSLLDRRAQDHLWTQLTQVAIQLNTHPASSDAWSFLIGYSAARTCAHHDFCSTYPLSDIKYKRPLHGCTATTTACPLLAPSRILSHQATSQ